MKFTVEFDSGKVFSIEGQEAKDLRSALLILWDNYVKQEQKYEEAFEKLLEMMR